MSHRTKLEALSRQAVKDVIHGTAKAARVPVVLHFWTHCEEFPNPQEPKSIVACYPQDVQIISANIPTVSDAPADDPAYRWVNYDLHFPANAPLDKQVALDDWSKLDGILENFPNPDYRQMFCSSEPEDGRYRIVHWWFCLFERHWQLRGMENALTDYYEYPDEVHRLFRAVTDFYLRMIERAAHEMHADAIFTSDDLGTQVSQFFSLEIFNTFFKPYYQEIADKIHALGMDFWLHTCGCVDKFIPSFVEIGVDVLHPIQKYTMDAEKIVAQFADKICFWAGFDVQQTIPYGSPDDVKKEVAQMHRVFQRENGRYIFGAGNGINEDCPLASLQALYEAAYGQV